MQGAQRVQHLKVMFTSRSTSHDTSFAFHGVKVMQPHELQQCEAFTTESGNVTYVAF